MAACVRARPSRWPSRATPTSEPGAGDAKHNGIHLDTGTWSPTQVDLSLPAPGFRWTIGRSYNVRQDDSGRYDSDGYQGVNWFQTSQPEIVLYDAEEDADDVVYLVWGADRYAEFQRTGTGSLVYKGTNGAAGCFLYTLGLAGPVGLHRPERHGLHLLRLQHGERPGRRPDLDDRGSGGQQGLRGRRLDGEHGGHERLLLRRADQQGLRHRRQAIDIFVFLGGRHEPADRGQGRDEVGRHVGLADGRGRGRQGGVRLLHQLRFQRRLGRPAHGGGDAAHRGLWDRRGAGGVLPLLGGCLQRDHEPGPFPPRQALPRLGGRAQVRLRGRFHLRRRLPDGDDREPQTLRGGLLRVRREPPHRRGVVQWPVRLRRRGHGDARVHLRDQRQLLR